MSQFAKNAFIVATLVLATIPAFAQAAPAQPNALMQLVPFIVVLGIMYFLMIRPQQKKQKVHGDFLANLKRGEEVVTSSGLLGRVEGLTDMFVTLEIAPGVRIKVLKSQIASYLPAAVGTSNEVKA